MARRRGLCVGRVVAAMSAGGVPTDYDQLLDEWLTAGIRLVELHANGVDTL